MNNLTERMFQDENFTVVGYEGERLESLIGLEDPENMERGPALIYIKAENKEWQRFFLDVSFAVWETCGEIEEDDSFIYLDYAEKFNVKNQTITSITCEKSEITISFQEEKLVLRHKDSKVFDGDVELIKKEN